MVFRMASCAAVVVTAGCVSSGTWRALHEVEEELASRGGSEPPPDSAAPLEAGAPTECRAIVEAIVARYPGLEAYRARARAALASARAEGAPPPPDVMLELWDFPIGDPQLADREGMYMLGLGQELPPADALDGRARAMVEEARIALAELAERAREIRAEAAHACADWSEAEAERARLVEAESVVQQMREAVIARFASSDQPLSDVLRIDAELAHLAHRRVEAEARRARAGARIEALLGLEARTESGLPPPLAERTLELELARLLELAAELRGAIAGARARARAAAARLAAAEAEASIPTFSIRATYMQMPGARAGLGAAFGMTLPWLWSGEGARRDAAREEVDAALDEVAALERDVRVEVVGAVHALEVVARSLAILREHRRPATARALEAVGSNYATGQADLLTWLDLVRAMRDIDIEEVELLGEAAHAWADLEGAVGAPLEEGR